MSTLSLTAAPMSHGGGCILRAPGGPVDLDRYPLAGDSRVDQVERYVRAAVGEEPRALADHHGIPDQDYLVDQVVGEQPADQAAAAVHLHLTRRLGFQLADGRREDTGADGRVPPARSGERGRCAVLRLRVPCRPEGAVARMC